MGKLFFKKNIKGFVQSRNDGFTLAELMVAASLFITAMIVIVGIFIQIVQAQRNINNVVSVNNNTSLVIEQMAREIRTGYNFVPLDNEDDPGCSAAATPPSYESLSFSRVKEISPISIQYLWNSEDLSIYRKEGEGVVKKLTGEDIRVNHFCFSVLHQQAGDPWRITLIMNVSPQDTSGRDINIQTTVSPRILPQEAEE